MRLLDQALRRIVRRGELAITDAGGRTWRYGAPDPEFAPVHLRFADRKLERQLARNPRLALGEAYMDGRLTFEQGDILTLIELVTGNGRWEDAASDSFLRQRWGGLRRLIRPANKLKRARANVAHHYDLGNELYRLFLDTDLQYSCAYFGDPDDDLETAQERKKAHIAAKLALEPGQSVLDIGCGWGGLGLYLNRVADVDVLGITLSERQLEIARARAAAAGVGDRVRFELIDYRRVEGSFDRIVSVGMFEHVGAAHYDLFFRKCRELLAPDGVMLLHTIGRWDSPSSGDPFADKYIFPGHHLPTLSQMTGASERARLITADVETLRLHYAYTLRHWLARTREAADRLSELYDARFVRMWEYYLCGALQMFENGAGCVFQVQYLRDRRAVPMTRDYLAEAERRYRDLAEAERRYRDESAAAVRQAAE